MIRIICSATSGTGWKSGRDESTDPQDDDFLKNSGAEAPLFFGLGFIGCGSGNLEGYGLYRLRKNSEWIAKG
jgi:hypothetical protein